MNYRPETRTLFNVARDLHRSAVLMWAMVVGAVLLAFIANLLCWTWLTRPVGDQIVHSAKASFVGTVTQLSIPSFGYFSLRIDTPTGPREVMLANIQVFDCRTPAEKKLRESLEQALNQRWVGKKVGCFVWPVFPTIPPLADVMDADNLWINGTLVELGIAYSCSPKTTAVVRRLRALQHEAEQERRGLIALMSPAELVYFRQP